MGPKSHETDNLRPLLLPCNLTKSVYVNNAIMKTLPYKNKETLIECNQIQFYFPAKSSYRYIGRDFDRME